MFWEKMEKSFNIPIKSWCNSLESEAMTQAVNLAKHPRTFSHVALMPDCHVGYGMPIGGVIACENAVIPNAVGVDIGCGMGAIQTGYNASELKERQKIRQILNMVKERVPLGEGKSHHYAQEWEGFSDYLESIGARVGKSPDFSSKALPKWLDSKCWELALHNLGSLGGGNHFIEIQKDENDNVWLMLHSGSRNLGYRIANFYHNLAKDEMEKKHIVLASRDLAFLEINSKEGKAYIRDMLFALEYARENRRRMMSVFKESVSDLLKDIEFVREINIHHNYANLERHYNKDVWVHRKGATSARDKEQGIIPGSMGTPSYIVEGLGNPLSFTSCSHGAGRKMGRKEACRKLSVEECDRAMGNVVFDRWHKVSHFGRKRKKEKQLDLSEAPLAYKDIDKVIEAELDLVKPLYRLKPLGVLKG